MTALPQDIDFVGDVTEGEFKTAMEGMLSFLRGHLGSSGELDDVALPVRQLPVPNGGCRIAQRGDTDITGTLAAAACDMWGVEHDGTTGTGTASRVATTSVGSSGYALQALMPASTDATKMIIRYRMESKDAAQLVGKKVTVACDMMHNDTTSKTGYLTLRMPSSAEDDFSATSTVPYVDGVDNVKPALPSMTPGTASMTVTAPAGVANGLEVEITTNSLGAGKWLQVSSLRVCIGGHDTGFRLRPYAADQQDCLRHFFKTFDQSVAPAQGAGLPGAMVTVASGSQNRAYFNVRFPIPMRATPTIVTYNPASANADAYNMTGGGDTPIAGNNIGGSGGRLYTDADTADAGDPMAIHLTADAGLF